MPKKFFLLVKIVLRALGDALLGSLLVGTLAVLPNAFSFFPRKDLSVSYKIKIFLFGYEGWMSVVMGMLMYFGICFFLASLVASLWVRWRFRHLRLIIPGYFLMVICFRWVVSLAMSLPFQVDATGIRIQGLGVGRFFNDLLINSWPFCIVAFFFSLWFLARLQKQIRNAFQQQDVGS